MSQAQQIEHSQLIDAGLAQLLKFYFDIKKDTTDSIYIEIMTAYYLDDVHKLEAILLTLNEKSFLYLYCRARIAILTQDTCFEFIKIFDEQTRSSPYLGDLYFAYAMICANDQDHKEAQNFFALSFTHYIQIKAYKKAQTARMNTITAHGNIDTRIRLLSSYIDSLHFLKEQGSLISAANTLVNIGDELYKIGALRSAYAYNEQALELLENEKQTLHYYEVLTHKCEILFGLEQLTKAKDLLKKLKTSSFSQINESAKLIENYFLKMNNVINEKSLAPAWRLRLAQEIRPKTLGPLEDRLVNILAKNEQKLNKLIKHLYPNTDIHDARNRLTTLVSRVNKKVAGLIEFNKEEQAFCLSYNEKVSFKNYEGTR